MLLVNSSPSSKHPLLSFSERWVLDVIRRHGPVVRADVTTHVDLAQQSVHRLVEGLVQRGFVRTGETVRRGRGQPSASLELQREAAYSVGISVNTDTITICLVDLACHTVEQLVLGQPSLHRKTALLEIRDALQRMVKRNAVPMDKIVGIGFALSGFFVSGGGINAPEPMRDWSLVNLEPELEAFFEKPIWIENNATTGAIGEKMRGAGLWAKTFVYISFNYGFGTGIVIDGKAYFGAHGNAGEVRIYTPGEESEKRPALRYLIEELRKRGIAIDTVNDLRDRFDPNWPGVEEWIERTIPQLDRAVNTLTGLLDPEAIVYGGQIPPELGRMLIERTTLWNNHRYNTPPPQPKLILSEANVDPSAAGAAMLPLDALFFKLERS
ncbi:NagC family transcriptional regulator [Rhizobium oryziradicis]|uniref:NagC family transcriptional regulator n=1 Tax=Rhizobium oryziradicis TaxID=1867956 RepID=A0A1Q8ZXT1_9HYPH|nr:NagC family transcriptional regulator [Rhizobium oryziradicis]